MPMLSRALHPQAPPGLTAVALAAAARPRCRLQMALESCRPGALPWIEHLFGDCIYK